MKQYQITQIGTFHTNHCEDYTLIEPIGTQKWLCAVMDGCTMGTDSYFASTLFGKILRKIGKEFYYKDFVQSFENETPKTLLKLILKQLWGELIQFKNLIQLEREELLSTLILSILDFEIDKGYTIVVGDGVICLNGNIIEFEQNNLPDYLAYHLAEDFEEWFSKQRQWVDIQNIQDISFSTDGILTFDNFEISFRNETLDILNYLLINKEEGNVENILQKKLFVLESEYGLKATDDLGIVRIINS